MVVVVAYVRVHACDECAIQCKLSIFNCSDRVENEKKDNFLPWLLLSVLSQPTAQYLLFFAIILSQRVALFTFSIPVR
jgi:hypothetical protein